MPLPSEETTPPVTVRGVMGRWKTIVYRHATTRGDPRNRNTLILSAGH